MSNIGGFDLDGDDKLRLHIAQVQTARDRAVDTAALLQRLIVKNPAALEEIQEFLDQCDILEADLKSMMSDGAE